MLNLSLRIGVFKAYSSCGGPRPCGEPLVASRTLLPRRAMATSKGAQRLLPDTDAHLISLLNAACAHNWDRLPGLAREFYAAGGSSLELAATSRFVVTVAGYAPMLKCTLTLHRAGLLPTKHPGKAGGLPGNAFELVYTTVTDTVRAKIHDADPVVNEWIRTHLYGDVYSSPGISLRLKQLLICSNLAHANMPDQLFGHALSALKFGSNLSELGEAIELAGNEMPVQTDQIVLGESMKILGLAEKKYQKDYAHTQTHVPEVECPPGTVRIPSLPPLFNRPAPAEEVHKQAEMAHPQQSTAVERRFAWEELNSRNG